MPKLRPSENQKRLYKLAEVQGEYFTSKQARILKSNMELPGIAYPASDRSSDPLR